MQYGRRPALPMDRSWQTSLLGPCLAASALMHGAVAVAWLAMPSVNRPSLPRVFQVSMLAAAPSAAADKPLAKPAAHSTRTSVPPMKMATKVHSTQAATPVEMKTASSAAIARGDVRPTQEAQVPLAAATEAAPSASPAVEAPRKAPAGVSLDAYAQTLSALLARQRNYPAVAAMRGWEGEVRLTLRIARRGALLEVQVEHSSGYEVLDRNAIQLVQQSTPLPQPPEGFDGADFQVTVPIQYRLRKSS